jgi:hypothetical protein
MYFSVRFPAIGSEDTIHLHNPYDTVPPSFPKNQVINKISAAQIAPVVTGHLLAEYSSVIGFLETIWEEAFARRARCPDPISWPRNLSDSMAPMSQSLHGTTLGSSSTGLSFH